MSTLSKINNEASWDRILRTLVGAILVSLIFIGPQTWWGLLGFIPLITGVTGFCPLYRLFGVSTCPTETPRKTAG